MPSIIRRLVAQRDRPNLGGTPGTAGADTHRPAASPESHAELREASERLAAAIVRDDSQAGPVSREALDALAAPAAETRRAAVIELAGAVPEVAAYLATLSPENLDHFTAVLTQILRERDPSLTYTVEVERGKRDATPPPGEVVRRRSAREK